MIAIMQEQIFERLAAMAGPERALPDGAHLFARGDPVQALYLVREGAVILCRFARDGGQVILQRAGPGEILAEASVFSGRYHCAAVTEGPTRLAAVPVALLRRALAGDATLSQALLAHMGQELRRARMRAEILALKTVRARLAAWIEWQGGGALARDVMAALPARGKWRSLAVELGVSPEALYREIARIRKEEETP